MRIILLVLGLICGAGFQAEAQCSFPTGSPDGACIGTQATDGANINSGQTFSYSGPATTFSNVNLNGGTLQVCGTLTIQNLNFNGGTIVVMSGGSLTVGGINVNTGSSVTNHGTITINGSLNVGGTDGLFVNYGTANLNGSFSLTTATADLVNGSPSAVINAGAFTGTLSGEMVNLGEMNTGSLFINGGSDVCLGPNSRWNTGDLVNDDPNGVIVRPAGSNACIRYTGNALLNNVLTSDASLLVCQAPGATVSGSGGFGAATVTSNCSGCNQVLPVVLASFEAMIAGRQIRVSWKSSSEDNVKGYGLEQSANGQGFAQVAFIPAKNTASAYQYSIPLQAPSYLRLRMQDRDGRTAYSKIIFVQPGNEDQNSMRMLCSPCEGDQLMVRLITSEAQRGKLIISNFSGQVLKQVAVDLEAGQQDIRIPLTGMAAGLYSLKFAGSRSHIGPVRWLKGR